MVYLSDETKSYTDMACTACAQALGGHVPNRGCEDCWSECTFHSRFSCLSMYACSMLLCMGALCTGYPPLGARQPTEVCACVDQGTPQPSIGLCP